VIRVRRYTPLKGTNNLTKLTMHFSTSALVLATLAIGQAAAATMYHGKQHNHAARHSDLMKTHLCV